MLRTTLAFLLCSFVLRGGIPPRPNEFVPSPGMVEAVNEAREEYAESRLLMCLQSGSPETAADTLKRVMADVNAFVGYSRQHDDITCLVLRVSS